MEKKLFKYLMSLTGLESIGDERSDKVEEPNNFKPELRLSKKEIIDRSLQAKGWTDKNKLSVLFDLVKKTEPLDGNILEIGSAWGRSTVLIGLSTQKTIWSIDPHTGGIAYIQKGEPQGSYDEFVNNLKKHALLNRVNILRNTTREVASQNMLPHDVKFSLVFIDGLHTPDGVKTDIEFAYDRLLDGGVMVFDDYFEPSVKDYALIIDNLLSEKKVDGTRNIAAKLIYFIKHEI